MKTLSLHYDFRAPDIGPPVHELYAAALEQVAWGEQQGFDEVIISSHHGCDDNYGPAPLVAAAAIAARTSTIRIAPVLALTLYHPLHVAEDVAVLDHLSQGRIELVLGAGYRPAEFAMFGGSMAERAARMEEGLATIIQAWTGEPFEFRGERIQVRPRPYREPHPPITYAGYSPAAARRAARYADYFMPMPGSGVFEIYEEACRELGREPAPIKRQPPWMFLHVTEDPERAWSQLAPHLLHVTNSYAKWMAEAGATQVYEPATGVEVLQGSGTFRVVTPDECIEIARAAPDDVMFDPLLGGIPPELAWSSLELAAAKVLPALRQDPGA